MTRAPVIALRNLLALALLFSLAACGAKSPQLPKLGGEDIILAFGDSLTYGTGVGSAESYPEVLAQLIGRKIVSAGVPGETTADGLERLPAVLDEVKPKLILLCMGGNDMLHKVEFSAIESNLRAMAQLARERGAGVVLIGVPKPALFGGSPEFYARIAKELSLPLENQVMHEVLFDNALKSDPIHPNARGYRRLAEAIAELLRRTGSI